MYICSRMKMSCCCCRQHRHLCTFCCCCWFFFCGSVCCVSTLNPLAMFSPVRPWPGSFVSFIHISFIHSIHSQKGIILCFYYATYGIVMCTSSSSRRISSMYAHVQCVWKMSEWLRRMATTGWCIFLLLSCFGSDFVVVLYFFYAFYFNLTALCRSIDHFFFVLFVFVVHCECGWLAHCCDRVHRTLPNARTSIVSGPLRLCRRRRLAMATTACEYCASKDQSHRQNKLPYMHGWHTAIQPLRSVYRFFFLPVSHCLTSQNRTSGVIAKHFSCVFGLKPFVLYVLGSVRARKQMHIRMGYLQVKIEVFCITHTKRNRLSQSLHTGHDKYAFSLSLFYMNIFWLLLLLLFFLFHSCHLVSFIKFFVPSGTSTCTTHSHKHRARAPRERERAMEMHHIWAHRAYINVRSYCIAVAANKMTCGHHTQTHKHDFRCVLRRQCIKQQNEGKNKKNKT